MSIGELLAEYGDKYLLGLLTTLKLTALSFAGALVLGIIITVMRVGPVKPLRVFANFYIQIFRNIP
ncbi:MAG: ABC transporter permease subunit, partial [Treponema sp.]|nr:ABC transporter permease subunit [Treponema sp.]